VAILWSSSFGRNVSALICIYPGANSTIYQIVLQKLRIGNIILQYVVNNLLHKDLW
jgi:hypothetical protein